MNSPEKEIFCRLMASLLSSPDQEVVRLIRQGTLHALMLEHFRSWGGEERLLDGFLWDGDAEALVKDLVESYGRLFSEVTGERISMVESYYKPWSQDVTCSLPFASEKGYLMGDSALHLSVLLQQAGLEAGEEFRGCPDHLVIELEFLAHLYRGTTEIETRTFIRDHLDWVTLLKEQVRKSRPHPFYISVLEALDLFLNEERRNRE
jgi:TorA maturation chaperone TorD